MVWIIDMGNKNSIFWNLDIIFNLSIVNNKPEKEIDFLKK